MLERYHHIIPFLSLMTARPPEVPNRPMLTRLVEQGIVGIIAAFIAIYVNDIRQDEQMRALKDGVTVARNDMRDMEYRIMAALNREHDDRLRNETARRR